MKVEDPLHIAQVGVGRRHHEHHIQADDHQNRCYDADDKPGGKAEAPFHSGMGG